MKFVVVNQFELDVLGYEDVFLRGEKDKDVVFFEELVLQDELFIWPLL